MNTVVTSREAILAASRTLVKEQGTTALNIRAVAGRCGIAVGSVYHYFPSKAALLSAAIEAIWTDIFHAGGRPSKSDSFLERVLWLFDTAREGMARYPAFFAAHSLGFPGDEKVGAREKRERLFGHMKTELLETLRQDKAVSPCVFAGALTMPAFVDFVFSEVLVLLAEQRPSCEVLAEVIRRVLYTV